MPEDPLAISQDPLVIFDGHCGFCRIWIEYWKAITGGRVGYAASQEVGGRLSPDSGEELQRIRTIRSAGRASAQWRTRRIHDTDLRAWDGLVDLGL